MVPADPWLAGAVGSTAAALVAVALLALLYAERQSKLVKVESEKLREQTEATRKIGGLATDLKTSLGESNRRLASLHLQRAETEFEAKQFGSGLLWAVESWRSPSRLATRSGNMPPGLRLATTWRDGHR